MPQQGRGGDRQDRYNGERDSLAARPSALEDGQRAADPLGVRCVLRHSTNALSAGIDDKLARRCRAIAPS